MLMNETTHPYFHGQDVWLMCSWCRSTVSWIGVEAPGTTGPGLKKARLCKSPQREREKKKGGGVMVREVASSRESRYASISDLAYRVVASLNDVLVMQDC